METKDVLLQLRTQKQNRIRGAVVTTICLSRIRLPNSRPGRFCIISSTGLPAQMILRHLLSRWKL